jgi:hypothetical protein
LLQNKSSLNKLTVSTGHRLLKLSAASSEGLGILRKLHWFAASTSSLKHFLNTVFVITFHLWNI